MGKHEYKVKSVIFDMDGVITHTMPDHFKAWHCVLKEVGIHATHLDIYSREGQPGAESVKELFIKYNKQYTPELAKKILSKKEKYFKKIARKRFVPGARNFIKTVHRKGMRLGLVTGTARHEVKRILPKELYKLFAVTVTGCEVVNGKPHPEPFLKAVKHLGIKKNQAVVIENAPFGIRAAKKAGLACIAIETSLPSQHLKEADHVLKNFKQINEKISFNYEDK